MKVPGVQDIIRPRGLEVYLKISLVNALHACMMNALAPTLPGLAAFGSA